MVAGAIVASGMTAGLATIFVVGSTAALTTIEFEPGAVADLNGLLDRLAPRDADYAITCAGETTTDRVTCAPRCSGRR